MSLLWTDWLFLSLTSTVFLGILYSAHSSKNRKLLRVLFQRPMAIISGVILLCCFSVAILDCLHTKPMAGGSKVDSSLVSVLDKMVFFIRNSEETSYSKPFASHALTAEMTAIDGAIKQYRPRLKYLPASIHSEKDKRKLIGADILKGLVNSLTLVLTGCALVYALCKQLNLSSAARKAWCIALVTLGVCLIISAVLYQLSKHFHIFGTGKIGQDVFYMTLKSFRTGLIIGTLTTLFMVPFALFFGICAGYYGGLIDDIIQYIYTTLSSIPGILLITASVLAMQTYITNHPNDFGTLDKNADARLLMLCFILGITSWTSLCRLLRAEALKLRELDFVVIARVLGTSSVRILVKHLLPNVMPIIIITLVLDFSFLVLAEAVLSYVGVGVSPLTFSWGNMINSARLELAREPIVWWPMLAAFAPMFVLVLASNLFADAVRDVLDPHHAG